MHDQSNINVMRKGSLITQDNLLFLKDASFIALRVVCSKRSEEDTWINSVHQVLFLTFDFYTTSTVVAPWRPLE